MSSKLFTASQIQSIADALADTDEGLSHSEISHVLASCRLADTTPGITKRHRLYNAFAEWQNTKQSRAGILAFIRKAMKPEIYNRQPERFETMRANLNRALAFAGLAVKADGTLDAVEKATTILEAARRANDLRADLVSRGVHPDVLAFCRAELVADNYFHAVLEAVKSVADKIRSKTGLDDDGGALVDRALSGTPPMLVINHLKTDSEQSEQRGFANLVRGIFGMFRNPTAHEARVRWEMKKEDAEDLLSLVSLVHRRLDKSRMPSRV
ncbi:MAG: TIGR02391 family protein [Mesorhizobium sp.]|uniref:TIGR02391 family protein n=1 Tax=Mesorhizobium sp. TaxID=1871066 RepID=UPI00120A8789|nr:TIGR02391 family protein [Mesorhizobium sp.]TIN02390.1 MAG: TIGR02391 family protein [Mesorhizobium sp.]